MPREKRKMRNKKSKREGEGAWSLIFFPKICLSFVEKEIGDERKGGRRKGSKKEREQERERKRAAKQ